MMLVNNQVVLGSSVKTTKNLRKKVKKGQINIQETEGNLLSLFDKGYFTAIAHGCNCRGVMGAGIALQIANMYPKAAEDDLIHYKKGFAKGGGLSISRVDNIRMIFNLYTQTDPGPNFNLLYFYKSFKLMLKYIREMYGSKTVTNIGIPYIGAGIGGGNWIDIREALELVCEEERLAGNINVNITIVKYNPHIVD